MRHCLARAAIFALLALSVASSAEAVKRALIISDGTVGPAVTAIRNELQGRGFEVVSTNTVPGDIGAYCCAWDLRIEGSRGC